MSLTKIPHDDILEGLYKLRIRESEKLKTVLELYDLEIHQKKLGPDHHGLKTMVKRSIEQEIRNKNFGIRKGKLSPNSFMQQNERKSSRTRSPRGRSPSSRMSRWPCKDYLGRTCNNSFCEKWHPPECLIYKTKSGRRFGEKCSFAHRQVDEQPTKSSKKNDDKSAVALLKKVDWQERGPVTDQCHDRSGEPGKRSDQKLGQKSSQRHSSNARQFGYNFKT